MLSRVGTKCMLLEGASLYCFESKRTIKRWAWESASAAERPAGPPPMMAASYGGSAKWQVIIDEMSTTLFLVWDLLSVVSCRAQHLCTHDMQR